MWGHEAAIPQAVQFEYQRCHIWPKIWSAANSQGQRGISDGVPAFGSIVLLCSCCADITCHCCVVCSWLCSRSWTWKQLKKCKATRWKAASWKVCCSKRKAKVNSATRKLLGIYKQRSTNFGTPTTGNKGRGSCWGPAQESTWTGPHRPCTSVLHCLMVLSHCAFVNSIWPLFLGAPFWYQRWNRKTNSLGVHGMCECVRVHVHVHNYVCLPKLHFVCMRWTCGASSTWRAVLLAQVTPTTSLEMFSWSNLCM